MGTFQSRPVESLQNKKATELFDGHHGPEVQSVDVITKVSLAMCVVNETYSGFFGKFLCKDKYCYGMFTNNHTLNDEGLVNGKSVLISVDVIGEQIQLRTDDMFRFTCYLLDATFIQFDEKLVQKLEALHCNFLTLHADWVGSVGEPIIAVQHNGGSDMQVAQSVFDHLHGFDIFHRLLSDFGSSGSPVVLHDGSVVGIHKRMSSDNCSVAVSTNTLLRAILLNIQEDFPKKCVSNPKELHQAYEKQVFKQSLICSKKVTEQNPLVYISPAIPLVITPIWFVPTSHGWYWTPTDPFKSDLDTNWMSVNQLQVIGGYWHNIEPADKNIAIIRWLRRNNYPNM